MRHTTMHWVRQQCKHSEQRQKETATFIVRVNSRESCSRHSGHTSVGAPVKAVLEGGGKAVKAVQR